MTVAAVVPHFNRRDLLEPLMASLRAQTRGFDEIVIADNGSTDGSADLAESLGARVLRLETNLGFAAAVNRGIQSTSGDWIAILNNDVTLAADWLEQLLKAEGSFATGKILNAADHSLIDGAFDEISRGGCAWRCGHGKKDSPVWNQPRTIRMASMTAAIFRRSLFENVGLLDEDFGSYLEDVDFGIRCALEGREGSYLPQAVAFHRGSATWGAWNKDTVKRISRNQIFLTAKHFSRQPRWPIVAGQMLWGLVALRHFRGVSYLRGKILGWKTARALYRERPAKSEDPIASIAEASEAEILKLQQQTGFDWYWRAYFWLLPR